MLILLGLLGVFGIASFGAWCIFLLDEGSISHYEAGRQLRDNIKKG